MTIIVLRKENITEKDLFKFNPQWLEDWKEWVVINNYMPFGSYDTQQEAETATRLLEKAQKIKYDIIATAESILLELTQEEREFLRKRENGMIQIEI